MVVWLPALFCAVLPQVWPGADGYGPVDRGGYECWIPDGDYEFLRWTYYGPLVVIIFQSLYLLWLVGKLSFVDWGEEWNGVRRQTIFRLILFVLIFILIWGEALVSRVLEMVDGSYNQYSSQHSNLEKWHIVMKGSNGVINGIIWLSSTTMKNEGVQFMGDVRDRCDRLGQRLGCEVKRRRGETDDDEFFLMDS